MEDILASIRRILNEDEAPPGGAEPAALTDSPVPAAAPLPPADDDGVLVLDEAMLIHEPQPAHEAVPVEVVAVPLEKPVEAAPAASRMPGDGLMAPESTAAAAASVGSLLRTLSNERTTQVYRGGPTIEDLVREEVRPLLKDWLDNHLPPLVERLVRQEIERVAGRAAL